MRSGLEHYTLYRIESAGVTFFIYSILLLLTRSFVFRYSGTAHAQSTLLCFEYEQIVFDNDLWTLKGENYQRAY